ncbi:MAG: sulfatase [Haliea sp.]
MSRRPNILLLMTDQQRYDSLGYSRVDGNSDTPNLDRLAAAGVIFDNAYSSDTACIPARSSLMTGLLPHRVPTVGVRPQAPTASGQALQEGYWTIAHALRDAGYRTGLFGKMHFTPVRAQHGFDVMQTCEHLPAGYEPSEQDDYRRWILSTGRKDLRFLRPGIPKVFPYAAEYHPTQWITRHAVDFCGNADAADAPWFAVVSYTDPHTPYSPPEPYASMFQAEQQRLPTSGMESNQGLPWPFSQITEPHPPGTFFAPVRVDQHGEDHLRQVLTAIRAGIKHLDDAVGDLIAGIDLETTLVIFLSDHGDYGGHRGFLAKIPWLPFDDLARVPFFIAGAGVVGGRRVQALVQSFDYVATALDQAGLPPPCNDLESANLASVLAGGAPNADRVVFCGTLEGTPMLRRGPYKHIWHSFADVHILYNLEQDPGETRNLARDHRYQALLRDNVAELRQMLARPVAPLWHNP